MCEVSDQLWTIFRTAARESACVSATACVSGTVTDCQRLLPARHSYQCLCGLLRLARHPGVGGDPRSRMRSHALWLGGSLAAALFAWSLTTRQRRSIMARTCSSTTVVGAPVRYIVGIDVGSETCVVSILRPDKTAVRSPLAIANA